MLFNVDLTNSTFSGNRTGMLSPISLKGWKKAPVIIQNTLLVKVIPKLYQINELRPFHRNFFLPHLFSAVSKNVVHSLATQWEDTLDIHLFTTQNYHGLIISSPHCKIIFSANTSHDLSINSIYIYECPLCVQPTGFFRLNIKEDTINIKKAKANK